MNNVTSNISVAEGFRLVVLYLSFLVDAVGFVVRKEDCLIFSDENDGYIVDISGSGVDVKFVDLV